MILTRGNLTFDTSTGVACARGRTRLAPAPALVLETLMSAPGVVSRGWLMSVIWRGRPDGPNDKALDVYVCHLRPMLAEIGADVRIETHYGRGYSIDPPGDPHAICQVPVALWREAVAMARRHNAALAGRMEQVEG